MATTTTAVAQKFLNKPLQETKELEDMPGVGDAISKNLRSANIGTPIALMGQFFLLNRDEKKMTDWLKDVCAIEKQHIAKIVEPLAEKAKMLVTL